MGGTPRRIASLSNATNDSGSTRTKKVTRPDEVDSGQLSFFDLVSDEDVLKEIEDIDISNLTPLDALNTLYRLQNKVKNRYRI